MTAQPGVAKHTLETQSVPDKPHSRHRRNRENALGVLIPHTFVQTQRLLLRWSRDPLTVLQALVFPAFLLIMLNTVLGNQITKYADYNALYGTVPMTTLVGVMSGSMAGAVALGRERDSGLLARFWVLPVHRASGLLARIVAEGVRILLTTIVLLIAGIALGFRFDQGFLPAVAFILVPLMFGIAFSVLVTAAAVFTAKATLVEAISLLSSLMMFFSTGFVPVFAFPLWIKPVVEYQPMSLTIEAMKGLSLGGPVQGPLIGSLLWSAGLIAVFGAPALLGYFRASRR
ncbi:ABC transporter permease [Antrihabitans sp. YC2-6]|uniref:ABC transporter permease n=1 Tax=Antrihabitans sp. YC2-6 TaxID=2799498 RepID=UPI0018F6160A|nr:ABC transporter permease [Antrihabitans sp. YC2-6]MBJ8343260.1 ABC transporter permease [Antrihabitans sp. YC2-6]